MEHSGPDIHAIVVDVVQAVAGSLARIEAAELGLWKARQEADHHLACIEQSYRLLRLVDAR